MSRDQIADLKDDLSGQIKELGLVKADVYDKHAKQAANMGTTVFDLLLKDCLLYTSPSPRDQRGSRMPSSA